jgi:Gram-negative bacterial TonB protein C-terminal
LVVSGRESIRPPPRAKSRLAVALGVSLVVHAAVVRLARVSTMSVVPSARGVQVAGIIRFETVDRTSPSRVGQTATAAASTFAGGATAASARNLGRGVRADSRMQRARAAVTRTNLAMDLSRSVLAPRRSPVAHRRDPIPRQQPSEVSDLPAHEPAKPVEATRAASRNTVPKNNASDKPDRPANVVSDSPDKGEQRLGGGTGATVAAGGKAGRDTGVARSPLLSRPATLLDPNACQDYYPSSAETDDGVVDVVADVGSDGQAGNVHIVAEHPEGQGFGAAAQRCLFIIRFTPALDAVGHTTRVRIPVRFRFTR